MSALSWSDLKTLDIVYKGTPAVFAEAKNLSSGSLDIVYRGIPFFGYPVSADISFTLTGLVTTASAGTVSRDAIRTLSGQSASASIGSVSTANANTVSGIPLAVALTTLAASPSKTITGQASSLALGTLSEAIDKILAGLLLSSATGTITQTGGTFAGLTLSLSGQALTGAQGAFTLNRLSALLGSSNSLVLGNLIGSGEKNLAGQVLTSSNGTLTYSITNDLTLSLSGQLLNLAAGTLSVSALKSLLGLGASSVITAPIVFNVARGQVITGSLGTLTPSRSASLGGSSFQLSSQALQAEIPRVLAGLDLVGASSGFSVAKTASLSGQVLTSALATLFKNSGSVEWVIYEQNPDQIIVASRDSKLLIELKNNILVITQD